MAQKEWVGSQLKGQRGGVEGKEHNGEEMGSGEIFFPHFSSPRSGTHRTVDHPPGWRFYIPRADFN